MIMGPKPLPKSFDNDSNSFPAAAICKCVSNGGSSPGNIGEGCEERRDEQAAGDNKSDQNASSINGLSASVTEKISKNLTSLNLSGQGITLIPDSDNLSGLQTLDLSHNEIVELPLKLKSSTHLRVLNLSHNRLTEFPQVLLDGLAVLKTLNVSFNTLETIPRPACVQHLNELAARSCHLREFPWWILFERHCLETLDLSINPVFEQFPLDFRLVCHSSTRSLKRVNFSNTYALDDRLKTLFSQLVNVEHVDLSNYGMKYCNRLLSCHELLGSLKSLKVLKMADVGLAGSPSLEGCINLETLNLAKNPMSWINPEFSIKSLRIAVLPNCFICSLPDNFGDMINLEYLNLSYNDLSMLPSSFVKFTSLKHLDLYQNSFPDLPEELKPLKQITCLDVCQNYFEPPSHPLGHDGASYEELKEALRATLAENRSNGKILIKANEAYLSDDGSGRYKKYGSSSDSSIVDSGEENNETSEKSVFIRPLPVSQTEEDWDNVESGGDEYFSGRMLQREFIPSWNPNEHFAQCLHYVPDRIRSSPFFYHRIDTSPGLPTIQYDNMDIIADGQFDD